MVRRASTASLRDSVRMIRPHAIHSSAGVAPARSMGINGRAPVRAGREPYVAESPDLPTRRDRGGTTRGIVYFHEPVCSVKGFYLFLSPLLFCHGRHTLGKSRRARSWLNGSACTDACISAPESCHRIGRHTTLMLLAGTLHRLRDVILAMNAEQAAGLRHIFFLEFAGTPFAWLAMAFVRCITHSRVDD